MYDERENKTLLLKYEVCTLQMIKFGEKSFVRFKTI